MPKLVHLRLAALAAVASPLLASAATAQTPELARAFPGRILAAHNAARAEAGVQPLTWDNELGREAAAYALRLALTNTFQHSDRNARGGTGENLWMGTRGGFSFEQMVGRWTAERRWFAPGIFPAVSRSGNWEDVGHYTQMVWPTTTRVGCAMATNAGNDFLVCRYSPAGNVTGHPVLTAAAASLGFAQPRYHR